MIPIWGSGRAAINDFQTGHYVWGTLNAGLAISDVFLLKAIAVGIGKAAGGTAFKLGSHSWGATRSWLGRTGQAAKGQHVHHWLLHRNQGLGRGVSNTVKNQPWNLMNMPGAGFHQSLHGYGTMNAAERLWFGTPTWAKSLSAYGAGRAGNATR